MSKISSLIKRAPKRFTAVVAMVAAAIIVPAAVFAWGPDRPTFTMEKAATYVTFNSITNNPNYGDERNFVTIKDAANTNAGGWTDEINVQNGKEYLVRMYVHNNAATNLNLVAHDVTAQFNVPTYEGKRVQIDGYLSSSNATPKKVWDQAVFSSSSNFKLDYIEGSAKYTNNVFTSGTKLSDSVVGSGAKLGYTKLDGNIPGCSQYSGVVTFKVKVVNSDFKVEKTVRVHGSEDKTFKESVAVKPGDKVDYQIYFDNTGGTTLKQVVVKDTLPEGVSYVPGTTTLYNANGNRTVADGITGGGIIIGDYTANSNAYLRFTAKVGDNDDLKECGPNKLVNSVKVTTDVGSKTDTADVTTEKDCEKPKEIQVCDLKTKQIVTINEEDFDSSKYSKNLADCDEVVKKIKVCELKTKEIVTINEADFDSSKYSKDLSDCDTPETPPELPTTGIAENVVAVIGLGALIASIAYYIASRRALV